MNSAIVDYLDITKTKTVLYYLIPAFVSIFKLLLRILHFRS